METLVNRFADQLKGLTHAEKHIFYYICDHAAEVITMSLTELADRNHVSTTTIIRMCSKLKLSGYSELKFILKNLPGDSLSPTESYMESIKNTISHNLDHLNLDEIRKLAFYIRSAPNVYVIAVGLTKPIGEYLSKLLMQADKSSFYLYESHMIDLLDKRCRKEDVIIFISNSGETKTLTYAAEKLMHHPCHTAAIINTADSSLGKLVEYPVNIESHKFRLNGYDITPRSTLVTMIDILFAYYLE